MPSAFAIAWDASPMIVFGPVSPNTPYTTRPLKIAAAQAPSRMPALRKFHVPLGCGRTMYGTAAASSGWAGRRVERRVGLERRIGAPIASRSPDAVAVDVEVGLPMHRDAVPAHRNAARPALIGGEFAGRNLLACGELRQDGVGARRRLSLGRDAEGHEDGEAERSMHDVLLTGRNGVSRQRYTRTCGAERERNVNRWTACRPENVFDIERLGS